jgi:acetolactate synthase I/II/III large subunit
MKQSALARRARSTADPNRDVRRRGSVASLICGCLKAEGVSTVFLVPGGPVMPMVEALFLAGGIRVVMASHEAGAAFIADGFQRVAGGIAVCLVTAGPGATNAVTAAACALREGIPMLLISGQPGLSAFGRDPAQDSSALAVDTVRLFENVTKQSLFLAEPERAADVVRSSIRCALAGRPGPTHIAIPADLWKRVVTADVLRPASYRADGQVADAAAVARAARLLLDCRQPVVLAGSGIRNARAFSELRAVVETLGAPAATTPKAKGVLPEDHPLSLQVFGFAGSPLADKVIFSRETDCLLVLGSRLGETASHAWDRRLRSKRIIQVDIEPTEIGKNFPVELGIVGDVRAILAQLHGHLTALPRRRPWRPARRRLRAAHGVIPPDRCLAHDKVFDDTVPLKPQRIVGELGRALPTGATLFVDVGACMAFAIHYLMIRNPNGFHLNLSFASMGHAVAAVVGAQLARPDVPAVCLCGDGAFLMTGAEVHTAVEARVPCTWVVLNNGGQGSVRTGVSRQFPMVGRRLGMQRMTRFRRAVDCAGLAEAMGALGFRVEHASELGPALRAAVASRRPAVVDVRVDIDEEPPLGMRLKLLDRFFNRRV